MAVPVVAGLLSGHVEAGLTIGLGAVLLAGAPARDGAPADEPRPHALGTLLPALLAPLAATLLAPWPSRDAATIALASLPLLLTSYSRPAAVAAIRFSILLILCTGFTAGAGAHSGAGALLFGLGALWNRLLRQLIAGHAAPPAPHIPSCREPTPPQRRAHFFRQLRTLEGWQFPLRLALGLSVASAFGHFWPAHHLHWMLLTVALLTERQIEHIPAKLVERLGGTLTGVALTWVLLATLSSHWALAAAACVLAALLPFARARSYLLYSSISSPLILLVLDFSRPIGIGLLTDRLLATVAGGAIAIAGNVAFDQLLAMQRTAATPAR